MTTVPPDHIHISEREPDGSWEDCTWDSGLEWYRLVYDARKPATHAEAQLLRRASGEPATGGSNLGDLARGIKVRYGTVIPARITGYANLKAALTPGKAAVAQGSMSAFGPKHRLSTWDRNFDGAHAVLLMNVGGTLLWCDPEAPTKADVPVIVSWAEVEKFVRAFNGQHVVGSIRNLAPKETSMLPLVNTLIGHTASIKPQSNIRVEPIIASAKVRTTGTKAETVAGVVGYVKGDVDPANGKNLWLGWIEGGSWRFTAIDNVLSTTAPAPTQSDCTAAVAAATAPLQKTIENQSAIIAEQKTLLAVVESFRVALKGLLGS